MRTVILVFKWFLNCCKSQKFTLSCIKIIIMKFSLFSVYLDMCPLQFESKSECPPMLYIIKCYQCQQRLFWPNSWQWVHRMWYERKNFRLSGYQSSRQTDNREPNSRCQYIDKWKIYGKEETDRNPHQLESHTLV